VNDRIRSPEIRLIGADGENIGVVTPARAMAWQKRPGSIWWKSPECGTAGLQDHGLRQVQVRTAETRGRSAQEAEDHRDQGNQVPPGTDTHDYDVKMRSVLKFLKKATR
jgi:translation initiation factor IF-3